MPGVLAETAQRDACDDADPFGGHDPEGWWRSGPRWRSWSGGCRTCLLVFFAVLLAILLSEVTGQVSSRVGLSRGWALALVPVVPVAACAGAAAWAGAEEMEHSGMAG